MGSQNRRWWSVLGAFMAMLLLAVRTDASQSAGSITALAVDPVTSSTIYAGTTAGVYKTTDSGATWKPIGPLTNMVQALVVAPAAPSTVYAAVATHGIFRSVNGGASWESVALNGYWVDRLAIDPQTPTTVYAMVANAGLFQSVDGGTSWTVVFSVHWLPGDFSLIDGFAIDPAWPNTLYFTAFYATWDTSRIALFQSDNGRTSWKSADLKSYPPTDVVPVDVFAVAPRGGPTASATIFLEINHQLLKSGDGGGHWRDAGLGSVNQLAFDPADERIVYAAGESGVSKSADGGDTWTPANLGLTDTLEALGVSPDVGALALDPHASTTLYAATAAGVFKTTDGGGHWVPTGLIQHSALARLTIEPASVVSGDPATGTVTLADTQTTDLTVTLSTSNAAAATVPTSVTIPAGFRTATFTISTSPVSSTTTFSIFAASGDATRGASLTLYPQTSVSGLVVDGSVTGGLPAAARVYVTRAPGSTGAVPVALSSSNSAVAAVPGSVTVPAGAVYTDFTISTSTVTAVTSVTISATNRTTASAALAVNPRPGSTPYTGTPVALPGTIEAENFDNGGANVAYHDDSPENSGGAYRATDVDLQNTTDVGGGVNVGWVGAGEWLNYTVTVAAAGTYTIEVRVASPGLGGTFHIEANGADKTGALQVPNTGGWQQWTTIRRTDVTLAAGTQVLRLVMDTIGGSGAVGNFNWIRVSTSSGGSTPYTGTPVALPGTIEAENFDNGGADVAYHDDSPENSGGAYRATDVDLQNTTDVGGGVNVGWVGAGEWLNYTVNVAAAGTYTIEVRVASPGLGGTFHIEANGADKTGALQVPNTGGWQQWTTIRRTDVTLAAGTQVLRLVMDTIGGSGAVGNFNWMDIQPGQISSPLTITAPAPGATLRTIAATFEWGGAGDDFTLNIGTTPGGSDVYTSGSLGPANQHTVPRLPLNGELLYVQVRRRIGTAVDVTNAFYTAPVRKALAIVTDFTDRTLEDWTGAGMKSLADVSAQLHQLEDHWAWLSRGQEKFQWNIVRIRLSTPAVRGAFSSWWEFRETVAALVKQQVDLDDYDIDTNGVLDVSWVIVCSGDAPIGDYAIGGSSMNGGVNMFVDGQASQSVVGGNTGNFTHEVGHLLGIVDMYGTYGTLGSLTIMSFSWDLPPGDFAAYERQLLGWLKPQVISQTTRNVWVPSASERIAAVKVPTSRASEYFLIEYRKKPESGYGSADVDYDGLVVYHVLEGSSMNQDPPLVKFEPADGTITPSHPTETCNFVTPRAPCWTPLPFVLYSYFGDGPEVFRLDNVAWRDGGMTFDLTIAPPQPESNLLSNASFESGVGSQPEGWLTGAWVGPSMEGFVWSTSALTGAKSAEIDASYGNDKWWAQVTTTLVAGQSYELCGWLKGDGIVGGSIGANVSLLNSSVRSEGRSGTFDWTQTCVTWTAGGPTAAPACRLGFTGSAVAGKLWCDDMSLVNVRRAF